MADSLWGLIDYILNKLEVIICDLQLENELVIRIYTRIRELLLMHKDVSLKVEQVERKLMKHDQKIELLFTYLSKFIEKDNEPRVAVGYKRKGE